MQDLAIGSGSGTPVGAGAALVTSCHAPALVPITGLGDASARLISLSAQVGDLCLQTLPFLLQRVGRFEGVSGPAFSTSSRFLLPNSPSHAGLAGASGCPE